MHAEIADEACARTYLNESMVGVQLREGAGGDEVDDAAGVHRVVAQVSSVPAPSHSHAWHRTHRGIIFHVHTLPYACMHAQSHVPVPTCPCCFAWLSHVDLTFCVLVPTLLSGRAAASHEVPPSTEESQG